MCVHVCVRACVCACMRNVGKVIVAPRDDVSSFTSAYLVYYPSMQASSSSLDYLSAMSCNDEKGERRSSVEGRHQRVERKGSGNLLEKQSLHDRKRSSLERSVSLQAVHYNRVFS